MGFYDAIRAGASGAAVDFTVERSLRFNDGDSPYLSRTPSSAGNRRTYTISVWAKIIDNGTYRAIIGAGGGTSRDRLQIFNDNKLVFNLNDGSGGDLRTTQLLRDPSAWYHIVVGVDTTQSTASDRIKLYLNGSQVTSFSTENYPSQNYDCKLNNNIETFIGQSSSNNLYFEGYLAEFNFIDGSQLTPSSFGETNADTGQWNPIDTSGLTFGTNGFRLKFADNSGTTATTLGKDTSGNGNNFTPNNFSVSAGTGNDSLEDTPTNNFCTLNSLHQDSNTTLSEGNLKATGSSSTAYTTNTQGTFAQSSGKWYYEVEYTSNAGGTNSNLLAVGWARTTLRFSDNPTASGGLCYRPAATDYIDLDGNDTSNDKPATTTGNVIQVAIDLDNGKIWFGNGGTFFESGNPATGANANITFTGGAELLSPFVRTLSSTLNFNFGQRAFSYTAPTGYKSLCSANLPDPTIKLPNKYFDTLLYTGNGSDDRDITGLDFSPDWLWIKERNSTSDHCLVDSVRGSTNRLTSSSTSAEATETNTVQSFSSNGFQVGTDGAVNENNKTYVAWNWNAGDTDSATYTVTVVDDSGNKFRFDGYNANAVTLDLAEGGTYVFNYPSAHPLRFSTTSDGTHGGGSEYTTGVTHNSSTQVTLVVASGAPNLYYYCANHSGMGGFVRTNTESGSSNFDGGIISDVKANPTAGFSIVGWTGTNGNGTLGHGLGVAPQVIIMKGRNVTDQWTVGHQGLDASNPWHKGIPLNTNASTQDNSGFWNDTAPTSTVFSKGTWNDGYNMVAYCFSEVSSFSKFGSYVGNSDADGTFVYMGFRPAWIMIKIITGNDDWPMYDNKRDPFNVGDHRIFANTSGAEGAVGQEHFDFVSNGIKFRKSKNPFNASGSTYIFLAFAESPFKYARAR